MRKKHCVRFLVVVLLLLPFSAGAFDLGRVLKDERTLAEFRKMVRDANSFPGLDIEIAAFLIETPQGTLSCERWPNTARVREQQYRGVVPAGVVGIIHTHPSRSERPSRGDVAQARAIGLPIYVLTRWYIYAVEPSTGAAIGLVTRKNWTTEPLELELVAGAEKAAVTPERNDR